MGKAYDGKKRWNETILATTARSAAAGGRNKAAKKRLSGRTHKLSAAMRRVDDDTRNEVHNAWLDALEADNFGEDADEGDGTQDGDEAYVDEEDGTAEAAKSGSEVVRKKRRVVVVSKKKWKVKSLAQLVFEELGNGEHTEGPNYYTAAVAPAALPPRRFAVCVVIVHTTIVGGVGPSIVVWAVEISIKAGA